MSPSAPATSPATNRMPQRATLRCALLACALGLAALVSGRAVADACSCPDCSCGASCPCSTH